MGVVGRVLEPTSRAASVDAIDVDALVREDVRLVLLDRDNTCVPRDAREAPAAVAAWFAHAREAGLALCLLTNNTHRGEVERSARELGVPVVHPAMKPAPFAVTLALVRMGVPAEQAVVVGDQVFTDVLAANLAGVRSILVEPQCASDLWYARPFRAVERLFLR